MARTKNINIYIYIYIYIYEDHKTSTKQISSRFELVIIDV